MKLCYSEADRGYLWQRIKESVHYRLTQGSLFA